MKYKIGLLLLLWCMLISNAYAQNVTPNSPDSTAGPNESELTNAAINREMVLMDSMLNVWYVKNEMKKGNSVLSKLKDDTTAYDNNDSMIFKRLSHIVTAVPLAYNDKVKRFIELYSVQRQRSSSVILGLAQYYYPWMKEIFDKYDVPEELVYITIIESALNPQAVSPAGATGIWQFMYGTGKLYGLEVNTFVDDRRDPYKATDAAARHLRDLYKIFNDWGLAISAYNCGAGNVRKAIQRSGGKTNFWGVSPYLPRETQNYFPAYIGALYMMTYHNLYGISPAQISIPINVDTVMVDKEVHFEQIAAVLNISLDEIKSLNPQYKKNIIPAYTQQFPLRLQSNDVIRYLDMKDSIHAYRYDDFFNPTKNLNVTTNENGEVVQVTPNKYHTVKKGETLSRIAAKYKVSVSQLRSLNHLRSNSLRVGQRLLIRKGTTIVRPKPSEPVVADSTKIVSDSVSLVTTNPTMPKDSVRTQPVNPQGEIIYVVKKGDTLSSIGRKYGVSATELAKYNHLTNMNALQVGQKIKIKR